MENSLIPTTTAVSDEEAIKQALEQARVQAVANLAFAQEEMGRRILEPTLNTKTLLDLAEHAYKVSGMAAKQKEQEAPNDRFVFNINFSGSKLTVESSPIHNEPIDVTPSPMDAVREALADADTLLNPPAYLLADVAGNLSNLQIEA